MSDNPSAAPSVRRYGQFDPGTDEIYKNGDYTNQEISSQSVYERVERLDNTLPVHEELGYHQNYVSTDISYTGSCSFEVYSQYTPSDEYFNTSTMRLRRRQNGFNNRSKSDCEHYESVRRKAELLRSKVKDVMSAPSIRTNLRTLTKRTVKTIRAQCFINVPVPTVEINSHVEEPLAPKRNYHTTLKNLFKLGRHKIQMSTLFRNIGNFTRKSVQKPNLSENVSTVQHCDISIKLLNKSVQCEDLFFTAPTILTSENESDVTLKPGDADGLHADVLEQKNVSCERNIEDISDNVLVQNCSSTKSVETLTIFENDNLCHPPCDDVKHYLGSVMNFSSYTVSCVTPTENDVQIQPTTTDCSYESQASKKGFFDGYQSKLMDSSLINAYYPDLISIKSHESSRSTLCIEKLKKTAMHVKDKKYSSIGVLKTTKYNEDINDVYTNNYFRQCYYTMNVLIRRSDVKKTKTIQKAAAEFNSNMKKRNRGTDLKKHNRSKKHVRFLKTPLALPTTIENSSETEKQGRVNNVKLSDLDTDLLSYLCALNNSDNVQYVEFLTKKGRDKKNAKCKKKTPKPKNKKQKTFPETHGRFTALSESKSDKMRQQNRKRKEPVKKKRGNIFTSYKLSILRKLRLSPNKESSKIIAGYNTSKATNNHPKNVNGKPRNYLSVKRIRSRNVKEKPKNREKAHKRKKNVESPKKGVAQRKKLSKTKSTIWVDTTDISTLLASIFADPILSLDKETNHEIQTRVSKSTNTKIKKSKTMKRCKGSLKISQSHYHDKRKIKSKTQPDQFQKLYSIFRLSKLLSSNYTTSKKGYAEIPIKSKRSLTNKDKKSYLEATAMQPYKDVNTKHWSSKRISDAKYRNSLSSARNNYGTGLEEKKVKNNVKKQTNITCLFKKVVFKMALIPIALFSNSNKNYKFHNTRIAKARVTSEGVIQSKKITRNNAVDLFGSLDKQEIPYMCRKCDEENKQTKVSQSTSTKRHKKKHHRRRHSSDPFQYVPDSIDPMVCSLKLVQKRPKYILKPDLKEEGIQGRQDRPHKEGPCGVNFESNFSFDISLNKGLNRLQAGKQVQQAAEMIKENRKTCRDTNNLAQNPQRSEPKVARTTATNISLDAQKLQYVECRPSQTELTLKPCICSLKLHEAEGKGKTTTTMRRESGVTLSATQTPITKPPFYYLNCPGPKIKRCFCAKLKKPTKTKSTKVPKPSKKSECECTQTEEIKISVGTQDNDDIPAGAIECKPGSCIPDKCNPLKCELKLGKKPCNLPILRSSPYSSSVNLISIKGKGTCTPIPSPHSKSTIAQCKTKSKSVPATKSKHKKTQQGLNISSWMPCFTLGTPLKITNPNDSRQKNTKSRMVQQGGTLTSPKIKTASHATNTKNTKTKNEKLKPEPNAKEKKVQVNENKMHAPTYKGVGIGTRSNDSIGIKIDSQIKLKIELFKKNQNDLEEATDSVINGPNPKIQQSTNKIEGNVNNDAKESKHKTAVCAGTRKDAGDFKTSKSCSCQEKSQSKKTSRKIQKSCSCKIELPKQEIKKPCKCDPSDTGLKKSKMCTCTLQDIENSKKLRKNCKCQTNPLNKKPKKPCKCKVNTDDNEDQDSKLDDCKCTLSDKEKIKKHIKHCRCQANPLNKSKRSCRCKLIKAGENDTKHSALESCKCTLKDKEDAKKLRKNCKCQANEKTLKPCKCKVLIEGDLDTKDITLQNCRCTLQDKEKVKKLIKNCDCKNNPLNKPALKPCKCKLDKGDDEPTLVDSKKPTLENCKCTLKDLANAKKMLKNCLCKIKKPCVCKLLNVNDKDSKHAPKPEECKCTLKEKENVKKKIKDCSCKDNPLNNQKQKKPCKCKLGDGDKILKKSQLEPCDCTLKDLEDAKKRVKNCICQTNPLNKKIKKACKCKFKEGESSLDAQFDDCKCTLKDKEKFKKHIKNCKCQTNPLNKNAKPCRCKQIKFGDTDPKHTKLENCKCTVKDKEDAKRLRKNCKCQTNEKVLKLCKCKVLLDGDLDVKNEDLENCKCTLQDKEKIKKLIKNCGCKNNPLNKEAQKPCECKVDKYDEGEPGLDGLKKSKLENCQCTLKDLANAKKMLRNCLCTIKKPCVCRFLKKYNKDVKNPSKSLKPEECKCTLQDKEKVKKLIKNCMCKDNPLNKPPRKPCKCITDDGADSNMKKPKVKDCSCSLKDKGNAKKMLKNCLCKVKNPCKCKVTKDDDGSSQKAKLESCRCTLKDKSKSQLKKCLCLVSKAKSKLKPCACKSGDSKDVAKNNAGSVTETISSPLNTGSVKEIAAECEGDTRTGTVNPVVRCVRALRGMFGRGDECGDGSTLAYTHSTNTDRPPTTSIATGEFQFAGLPRGKKGPGLRVTSGIHLGIEFYKQIAPKESLPSLAAVQSAPGLPSTPGTTYLPNAKPARSDSSFDSFIRPKLAKQLKCTDDPKYLEKVRKFACKPGVCVPNTCVPNVCYERVRKRLGIGANTKTKGSECAIRPQLIPARTVKHKSSTTVWTSPLQGGKGDDNGVCPPGVCEISLEYPDCDPEVCYDKLNNLKSERKVIKTERKSSLIDICGKLSAIKMAGRRSLTKIFGLCNLKQGNKKSKGSLTRVFDRCYRRKKSTQTKKRCFCVSKIKRTSKCTSTNTLSSKRIYQAKGSQSETIRHKLPFPGSCVPKKDEISQSYQSLMRSRQSQSTVSTSSATCMDRRLQPQVQESRTHVSLQTTLSRLPCPGGRKDVGVVCDEGICMPGECRPIDCAKKMNIKTSTHANIANAGTEDPEANLKRKDKTVQARPELTNRVNKKMNITERDIAREYAPCRVANRKRRGCETDLSFQFEIRKNAAGFCVKPKKKQGTCTCLSQLDRTYGCAFCTTVVDSPFEYVAKKLDKTQPSTDITQRNSNIGKKVDTALNNCPSDATKRVKITIDYNI